MSAVALGLGTMMLPFATMYFSHIPAAAASFAAFALLVRERDGPFRPLLVFAAGLLAGLAVVFEYPSALIGLVLAGYVLGVGPRLARGVAYATGVVVGVIPLIAYQWIVYGSPAHTPYDDVVAVAGTSGHDVVGPNGEGFLGVTTPSFSDAVSLLIGDNRGLLILSPLVLAGVVGLVLLWRMGRRAESLTCLTVGAALLVYNSGYTPVFGGIWGGGTPGPRLLLTSLPFVMLGAGSGLPPSAARRHCVARRLDGDLCRRDGHVPADRRGGHRAVDMVGLRSRIHLHRHAHGRARRARRLAVRSCRSFSLSRSSWSSGSRPAFQRVRAGTCGRSCGRRSLGSPDPRRPELLVAPWADRRASRGSQHRRRRRLGTLRRCAFGSHGSRFSRGRCPVTSHRRRPPSRCRSRPLVSPPPAERGGAWTASSSGHGLSSRRSSGAQIATTLVLALRVAAQRLGLLPGRRPDLVHDLGLAARQAAGCADRGAATSGLSSRRPSRG